MPYKDPARRREYKREHNRSRVKLLRLLTTEYKAARGCVMCGEKHPACLDFHHKNPLDKSFTIGKQLPYSQERVLREMEKCVILCSNCHRKLHWSPGAK